jgi:predicted PurR-regulated permease PerM
VRAAGADPDDLGGPRPGSAEVVGVAPVAAEQLPRRPAPPPVHPAGLTVRTVAVLLSVLAAAFGLLWLLRGILAPFALAALLAYLVGPAVERLHRHAHLPRPLGIFVAYAGLALAVGAFAVLVLPDLIAELQRLGDVLPALTGAAQRAVDRLRAGYGGLPLPPDLRAAVDAALVRIQAALLAAVRQTLGGALGLVGLALSAVLAPVLAYYLLADLPRIKLEFARLLPPSARQPVLACLADLDAVLAGWIRGQLLLAAAVGALATVALLLLRVRFAFTLGLVAGLGELVPYFGPVLGAIPALAVAATTGGLPLALEVGLAFLLIQQTESMLLAPRIVGGSVGLHPLVVIASLLVGERLGGLWGVVLAVPAAACLRVLGRHVVRALTSARPPRRLT